MDEPNISKRVSAFGGLFISVARSCGFAVSHAECTSNLQLGIDGFDRFERLALRDVYDVRGLHTVSVIRTRGSVNTPSVTEECEDPRFIDNAPILDALAERFNNDLRIVRELGGEV